MSPGGRGRGSASAAPTPVVRAAGAADLPALVALEAELFGVDAWSLDQLHGELVGPGRRAWVSQDAGASGPEGERSGERDGLISGYAITMTVGDIADLQRIGVHPARRRSGVARALLETAAAQARADGADRMLLEVSAANTGALSFYTAGGFIEIDRRPRYYKDGSDAMVLRRSLARACNWS